MTGAVASRACNKCGEHKPYAMFSPARGTITGVGGVCKACKAEAARVRYATDPDYAQMQRAAAKARYEAGYVRPNGKR